MENIKWELFTPQEKECIELLVARGDYEYIAKAISLETPEKEAEVNEILSQLRPAPKPVESKVESELLDARMHGKEIETPEQEAEWQKKLDEEQKKHAEKVAKEDKRGCDVCGSKGFRHKKGCAKA